MQTELEGLVVARVDYAPQDGDRAVFMVRVSNAEATGSDFEAFVNGGFWGDGEEMKFFDAIPEALQAIGREMEKLLSEEEAGS